MKRIIYTIAIFSIVIICHAESFVDDFTRISVDPYIEASGGTFVASGNSISSPNFNPALMASEVEISAMFSHSNAFGGLYSVDFLSANYKAGEKINIGGSFFLAGGDGIPITALANPEDSVSENNRPYLVEEKSHYDIILNPAMSYKINNKLSAGASLRLAFRNHIDEKAYGGGLSAGILYSFTERTKAGLYVRNLSSMPMIWEKSTEIALPSSRAGIAHDFVFSETAKLKVSGDIEYLISEEIFDYALGANLLIYNNFGISTGYSTRGFSAGASFMFKDFGLAASYTTTSNLEDSYRIGLIYYPVRM